MATIAKITTSGPVTTIAKTTLTGADTFTDKTGYLYIHNDSGSSANIVIDGDEAAADYETNGAGDVDLTGGYTVTVANLATVKVDLRKISGFLAGTIAVTGGGAGIYAWIE